MPPKGIDYSKWDKLECSSSSDDDGNENDLVPQNDDDDDDYETNHHQQNNNNNSSTSYTTGNNTSVQKFNSPTTITFGGSNNNNSSSSEAATISKKSTTKVEVTVKEPLMNSSLTQDGGSISKNNSNNNKNNSKKKPKSIRNGCVIPLSSFSHQQLQHKGMFWSQTAETVTVGIVLEIFTMQDFLDITDGKNSFNNNREEEDLGIDEAIRKWNTTNKNDRVKVKKVEVHSSRKTESHHENVHQSICQIDVSLSSNHNTSSSFSIQLAYDARPMDLDTLWSIELLSSFELPGMMSTDSSSSALSQDDDGNNNNRNNDNGRLLRPETILASRCLVIELKKLLPGDFNPYQQQQQNDSHSNYYESEQEKEERLGQRNLISNSTGLKFWWDKLLLNGLGRIDVIQDIEDRVSEATTTSTSTTSTTTKTTKQDQMKQAWDEAHRMFREKMAARKEKEANTMHQMLLNNNDEEETE